MFKLSILRLFAPYGPGQAGRLIPELVRRIRQGEAITLPADGKGMRMAPTYVDDICTVIETALVEDWQGIFNVAAPAGLSLREIAELIGKVLERPVQFKA